MEVPSGQVKRQMWLDTASRKWWLYLLLLVLFFFPSYAARSYDPRQSTELVAQTLSNAVIFAIPWLMPAAKLIPLVLIVLVLVTGNRFRAVLTVYAAVLYLAVALFQNSAVTDTFGLVILLGNMALVLVVALLWFWELSAKRNDFSPRKLPIWRWWVIPVALLAFLSPIESGPMTPDFNPLHWVTNEAGLTFCMMTPVFLAMLTLLYPRANLPLLRVLGFAGILFGAMNLVTWFVLQPWGWWMGVLHLPLISISIYAFALPFIKARDKFDQPAETAPAE